MKDSKIGIQWAQKDGIITDSKTGLQWAQDAGGKEMTWHQANNYIHPLKIGGYSDWRLPSKEELKLLADYAESLKDINNRQPYEILGFKNVASHYYFWSSSTYADNTDNAWIVNMYYGHVHWSRMSDINYVWPVRAGQ